MLHYYLFIKSVFTFPALDSGMFYDGNHTYLIEPDENYTSDVSRTCSPVTLFVEYRHSWVQHRRKALGPKGHCLIPQFIYLIYESLSSQTKVDLQKLGSDMCICVYSVTLGYRAVQHQRVMRVPWSQQEKPVSAALDSLHPSPPGSSLTPVQQLL